MRDNLAGWRGLKGGGMALVVLFVTLSTTAQANIYRWRDAKGAVHYDQSLPDNAISRGYEVLNEAGDVLRRVPPPATPAQQAAARTKAAAAARLAAQQADQQRQDRMLLQTFDSVGDIKDMRNQRLKALHVQIELARDRVRQLSSEGPASQRMAAHADLTALLNQELDVRHEFARDIKRFRELQRRQAQ